MSKRSRSHAAARRKGSYRATARKQAPPEPEPVDFREEYRYVLSDLKRFGILAVSMFALLVILALVI